MNYYFERKTRHNFNFNERNASINQLILDRIKKELSKLEKIYFCL